MSAGEAGELPMEALVRVGQALARRARGLGAQRVCLELVTAWGPLWLSWEPGAVWATLAGRDVELSALAQWRCPLGG